MLKIKKIDKLCLFPVMVLHDDKTMLMDIVNFSPEFETEKKSPCKSFLTYIFYCSTNYFKCFYISDAPL